MLAASNQDNEVNCYDPAAGTALFPGLPHTTGVVSVSVNRDGSEIVTITADGTARLWRIPTATVPPPKWLGDCLRAIGGLAFTPEQQLVQISTKERLKLRQELLSQPPKNSTWDKIMRWSFVHENGSPEIFDKESRNPRN